MTNIIIPSSMRTRRSNPLREFLETRDGKKFRLQVTMSDALSSTVARVAKEHRMQTKDVLDAMVTALVSCAQAAAPHEEWNDVGAILADVVRDRMTVTGVNSHGE
jgi:hypothetical protein